MSEARINELESKLSFLEHAVSDLNQGVYEQQKRIDRLEETCVELAREAKGLADRLPDESLPDEKPPHY